MDNYSKLLVSSAEKLDSLIGKEDSFKTLVFEIVEGNEEATKKLIKGLTLLANSNYENRNVYSEAKKLNDLLVEYYGKKRIEEICKSESIEDSRTLDELLDDLNSLVGLNKVKEKVNDLIAYQKVQKLRRENGLYSAKSTLHMAFTGNPGTGKTTVARIVGHIYKQIGLLSKGHFVEVSRTDLIAGYQGQTALKVKAVIEKSKGGVLFIDEAYSITENDHSDSYGRECLTELTKALEDCRDDLVVIVAGYTEPMKKFFESNPGLKSRFNTFIEFEDYNSNELYEILNGFCKNNDYILSKEIGEKIKKYIDDAVSNKDDNFSNGRLARNIYDDLVMNHAKRVNLISNPTYEDLSIINAEDFSY